MELAFKPSIIPFCPTSMGTQILDMGFSFSQPTLNHSPETLLSLGPMLCIPANLSVALNPSTWAAQWSN